VSHDLRRPLRAIDGFSRILLEKYAGNMDGDFTRLLNIVRSSTQDMTELTDGLLVVSRVGRQEMRVVDIDMKDLASRVRDELGTAAAPRHLEFVIGELPPARGDRAMIRQVFVNLLSNAVKFTSPRDRAVIEVGHVARAEGPAYYVQDNGVGFDGRYVDKLFGVFERLHHAGEFEGTGVGLAIVKRIIERHGGCVWAEGKVNEGATVYFSLPPAGPQPA
jgi:two-component system sensor kinase